MSDSVTSPPYDARMETKPPVDIVRSTRRRKTVQAVLTDGRIKVMVPHAMSDAEARRHAFEMSERILRKRRSGAVDLDERARRLARTHDLPEPASITWSSRQNMRWGSCTPSTGAIRISDRIADMPPWVLDYVIVHELAHLIVDGHSPLFEQVVDRYPLAERSRGYLIAKSEG